MRYFRRLRAYCRRSRHPANDAEGVRLRERLTACYEEGRFRDAELAARRLVELQKELMGDQHAEYATGLYNLALLLLKRGDLAGALELAARVVAIRRVALGSLTLAVAALTALHVAWVAPFYVRDDRPVVGPSFTVLEQNVYLGRANTLALTRVAQRADVVVLPYREIDQSGVLFTALAFGRPMVLSNVGGFPDIAREGAAELVPPGEAGPLARALGTLLHDGARRRSLAARASQLAAGPYSWDAIAAEHQRLYRSLLG